MTEDQLLEALRAAQVTQDDDDRQGARTSEELQDTLGWTKDRVLDALRRLSKANRLEVRKVPKVDIAGRTLRVPAYRLRSNGVR